MLAKLTAKNQLTLPKAAIDALGTTEYFEITVRAGQLILTPVRIQRANAVRAKLAALKLDDDDLAAAVAWARTTPQKPAPRVAESKATYRKAATPTRKPARRSK